jgi:PREDICTED: similar to GA17497-PA, partial
LPDFVYNFDVFLQICDSFYLKTGVDLLSARDERLHDNPKLSLLFATQTAFQISLIEYLRDLNIVPNGLIGYSIGEYACSYAEHCYDINETILIAYTLGKKIDESGLRRGRMAIIEGDQGQIFQNEAMNKIDFNNAYIAGYNDPSSFIISGFDLTIDSLIQTLKDNGIKSQSINSFNTPLHCSILDFLWDTALESLYSIISSPKHRSTRWVSTTIESQNDDLRLSCPRYFIRNITSPILFHQACKEIPKDAIIVEMSYQASLKNFVENNLGTQVCYLVASYLSLNNNDNLMADLKLTNQLEKCLRERRRGQTYELTQKMEN